MSWMRDDRIALTTAEMEFLRLSLFINFLLIYSKSWCFSPWLPAEIRFNPVLVPSPYKARINRFWIIGRSSRSCVAKVLKWSVKLILKSASFNTSRRFVMGQCRIISALSFDKFIGSGCGSLGDRVIHPLPLSVKRILGFLGIPVSNFDKPSYMDCRILLTNFSASKGCFNTLYFSSLRSSKSVGKSSSGFLYLFAPTTHISLQRSLSLKDCKVTISSLILFICSWPLS